MSQNIGTLISASIRPNDSLDPIASAFANEIKGGLHSYQTLTNRDSIILQRREWGMLVYVVDNDELYQLRYLNADNNIMNNSNWVVFTGGNTQGTSEWLDSVISLNNSEPSSPTSNQRYLVSETATGINWTNMRKSVVEWNSTNSTWIETIPTIGMTVRADDMPNIIYKYNGTIWISEKISPIFNITTSGSANTYTYNDTKFTLDTDIIILTKFNVNNFDTSTLDINGIGAKTIKIATKDGSRNLISGDIKINTLYSLTYDGTNFQMVKPFSEGDENVKYYIATASSVTIKPYEHYWVYGDLTLDGTLINYGDIVIANGNFVNNSNNFQQYGRMIFIDITTPFFTNSLNIGFTQSYGTHSGSSFSAYVKDDSLLPTNLNTNLNGGATSGYILSTDNSGKFKWVSPSNTDVSNKVDIELGKSLILDTEITKLSQITLTQPINLDDVNDRINELDSAVILKGTWDPTTGSFPSSTDAGWSYIVTDNDIVDGVEFSDGDRIISILDSASTSSYTNNWYKADYTDKVNTVAGKTGTVLLVKADVGLNLVDNTTDISKNVLSATKLTTARLIGGVSFDGSANINLPGVNAIGNQNTTGNSATATKLASSVTINGVSFDGSANITIATGGVTSVAGKTGVVTLVKADVGLNLVDNTTDVSKNVLSATKLTTARLIGISGVTATSQSFDGTTAITIPITAIPSTLLTGTINQARIQGDYNGFNDISGNVAEFANFVTNNGSVTQPSYSFSTDLDTGIFLDTPGKLAFTTGGVQRMTITEAEIFTNLPISGVISEAKKLETGRNINGVFFDGTQNITNLIEDLGNVQFTGTIATNSLLVYGSSGKWINQRYNDIGLVSTSGSGATGTWGISVTGNAATSTKLATARSINGVLFDGTQNIVLNKQIAVGSSSDTLTSWNGCTVVFNADCTITLPLESAIPDSYVFDFWVLPGVTVTWAINPSSALYFSTGSPGASYGGTQLVTGVIQRLITSNIVLHKIG